MENKSLGRSSTTTQGTMRDNPPCPDGGQGGGMRQLDFEIELAGAVDFLRALADVLEFKFGECGDKDFAAAVVRVCGIARRKADRIKAVLVELAKTGEVRE